MNSVPDHRGWREDQNSPSSENGPACPNESFREFYEMHFGYSVAFFARKGFSSEDAMDLAQETFVRAYRYFDGFRGESRPRTWLTRIAINVFKNHLRHREAEKRQGQEVSLEGVQGQHVLPVSQPSQLNRLIEGENRERFERELSALPVQMQRCVRLRIEQGRKYQEIASLMRLSIQTVKSQLHDARKRLRENLADLLVEDHR